MNYHDIKKCDMLNGDGIRVTLFVSGCDHHCEECQNKITWNYTSGILFNKRAENEIFEELDKDYVSGLTLSGGDPLNTHNLDGILKLVTDVREKYGDSKTIWIYTGYTAEELFEGFQYTMAKNEMVIRRLILAMCDVLVDGKFVKELADVNFPYRGSTNQRLIDLKKTFKEKQIVYL